MTARLARAHQERGPDATELPARLRPVFIEPSGRRWRAVVAVVLLAVLALAGLVALRLAPAVAVLTAHVPGPGPESIALRLGSSPAVIGTGPMVRVVAVSGGRVSDPFTGAALGTLDAQEALKVGPRTVAVQRYGYGSGTRQIVLTFDDGPDPTWTPKVLAALARNHVHATFFVTGRAVAAHPELARQIVAEGNVLGNHSISHKDLSAAPAWRARLELVGNEHVVAGLTGQEPGIVRPPYDGGTSGAVATEELAIARAQQLGFPIASYDTDTHDWVYGGGSGDSAPLLDALPAKIPLPSLDGRNLTLLMHDAGGNRAHTVDYLENSLIPAAKAAGYTFETVPQAQPGLTGLTGPAADPHSAADRALIELVSVWLVYPNRFTGWLFVAAVLTLSMTGVGYALLALVRARLRPAPASRRPDDTGPALGVSVLIAAYNEATVIEATLRSLVTSTYPVSEFVVVDDGSSDDTAQIVRRLAQTLDPRIRLIQQENGRKPAALNTGLAAVTGEIVVTVDADTRAHPTMVADLVRHFEADPYGTLGAVAGVVHVGNRRQNLLTRWQALEYLTQIGVERAAHDLLGAITIVPGACAAWRREAVLRAGGFSEDTLAEDCDLTLALHRMGWRVTQDDEARADTEAPEDVDSLLKQRVRWTYGTLQAITKHRDMVLRARYGWLGLAILPWAAISIAVPLVTMPLVAAVSVAAFTTQGPAMLGGYYLAFTAVQTLTALIAVRLLHETVATLSIAPVYRLIYEPLRAYLLTMSSYLAVRGVPVGWNKLVRTGTVSRNASAAHPTVPRPRRGGAEVDAGKENAR